LMQRVHHNEQIQMRTNRELRDTRAFLEARIALRTRDLDLAAEAGRRVSQVRDLDALLAQAVELIRVRFDLYYTQIYLADPAERVLTLRSGTGAVGAELVKRGHRLLLGPGSINGAAAVDRRAVVVSDTKASSIFKPNPLLPETRSEIAVPLIAGDRLMGVLDLQSSQAEGLTTEQLVVFQALAGQLAVAIENANLFAEAEEARTEVEAQARRLTGVGWKDFLDGLERSERLGYTYDLDKLAPLSEPLKKSDEPSVLAAPVSIAGESIGLLKLEAEADRDWTEDEIAVVQSVARQIAQQTENLRLFSQTERYRREAEEAARRLAREGWEEYLDKLTTSINSL
jgi:GAF domain-containing protein